LVPASIDFCGSPREQECRASHETNHISKELRRLKCPTQLKLGSGVLLWKMLSHNTVRIVSYPYYSLECKYKL